MEAVDCSFQDLRGSDKPFGGVICCFGEIFSKFLQSFSRFQSSGVGAYIKSLFCEAYYSSELHQNMHLNTHIEERPTLQGAVRSGPWGTYR